MPLGFITISARVDIQQASFGEPTDRASGSFTQTISGILFSEQAAKNAMADGQLAEEDMARLRDGLQAVAAWEHGHWNDDPGVLTHQLSFTAPAVEGIMDELPEGGLDISFHTVSGVVSAKEWELAAAGISEPETAQTEE